MSVQTQNATLLIIASETSEAERLISALREDGFAAKSVAVPHAERLDEAIAQRGCDMILCCSHDRNIDLDAVLTAYRKLDGDVPLILIADAENAAADLAKARRGGARDLIRRNDNEQLKLAVTREFADLLRRRDARGLIERHQLCERRSRELIEVTSAGVAFIQDGLHIDANPAYLALFGYDSMDDLQGATFLDLVVPEQQKSLRDVLRGGDGSAQAAPLERDLTCRRADGTEFKAHLFAAFAEFDSEPCLRLLLNAMNDSRTINQTGSDPAHGEVGQRSELTRLLDEIETHIGAVDRRVERPFAIFYIRVKDSMTLMRDLGLTSGLELLNAFASALAATVAGRGFLARLSQDGFGLIVDGLGEFDAKALAEQIAATVRLPSHATKGDSATADCDIGYYLVSDRAAAAEDIINAAHRLCLDHAHHAPVGSPPTSLAARTKQEDADDDTAIARKIEDALHHDRLKLVYQPIISLMGDNQENYSVLMRLLDAEENLLEGKDFIGPAIRGGLIEEIDKWAIRTAIRVIGEQRRAGHNLGLFINLSEDTFRNPSVVLWICDCLREFDVRGNWLTFQFQEELVTSNLTSISKLVESLKKIKCRVAMNRFGENAHPERLLQGLSLDFVLMKPEFAQGLADDQTKQQQILKLANLAREFNVKSIVTGVEDARALTVLWTAGVDYVQGNFLQRPSPTLEVQA